MGNVALNNLDSFERACLTRYKYTVFRKYLNLSMVKVYGSHFDL